MGFDEWYTNKAEDLNKAKEEVAMIGTPLRPDQDDNFSVNSADAYQVVDI